MCPDVLPAPVLLESRTSAPVAVLPKPVISSPYRACQRLMPPNVFSDTWSRYRVELRCAPDVAAVLPHDGSVPGAVELKSISAKLPTDSAPTQMVDARARIMDVGVLAVSSPPI